VQWLNRIPAVKLIYKLIFEIIVEHLFFECQTESGFFPSPHSLSTGQCIAEDFAAGNSYH